jgi:hypothetical protein
MLYELLSTHVHTVLLLDKNMIIYIDIFYFLFYGFITLL